MTTGLQLMVLAGGMLGLGVALLVIRLVPAQPDLADALARLTPSRTTLLGDHARSWRQGKARALGDADAAARTLGTNAASRAGAPADPARALLRREAHLRWPWGW